MLDGTDAGHTEAGEVGVDSKGPLVVDPLRQSNFVLIRLQSGEFSRRDTLGFLPGGDQPGGDKIFPFDLGDRRVDLTIAIGFSDQGPEQFATTGSDRHPTPDLR